MASKAVKEIINRMKDESDVDCVDTALSYLNELISAGMDYADAFFKVTDYFFEVDEDDLEDAYDDQ